MAAMVLSPISQRMGTYIWHSLLSQTIRCALKSADRKLLKSAGRPDASGLHPQKKTKTDALSSKKPAKNQHFPANPAPTSKSSYTNTNTITKTITITIVVYAHAYANDDGFDDGWSEREREIVAFCREVVKDIKPEQERKVLAAADGMELGMVLDAISIAYEKGCSSPDYIVSSIESQRHQPDRRPGKI